MADSYKYKIGVANQIISTDAQKTKKLRDRIFGLLGKPRLQDNEALIMHPCFLVDTFFMKYPIDVAFVNRNQTIVALYKNLKPYRMTGLHLTATQAIEWPQGTIEKWNLTVGTPLKIEVSHV